VRKTGADQRVEAPTELLLELQTGLEQACWDPVTNSDVLKVVLSTNAIQAATARSVIAGSTANGEMKRLERDCILQTRNDVCRCAPCAHPAVAQTAVSGLTTLDAQKQKAYVLLATA